MNLCLIFIYHDIFYLFQRVIVYPNGDIYILYYTRFEITGGPCNLIGSNWCTIAPFFALNCIFFLANEGATLKTKQPIRPQGLFKVTDQIAGS